MHPDGGAKAGGTGTQWRSKHWSLKMLARGHCGQQQWDVMVGVRALVFISVRGAVLKLPAWHGTGRDCPVRVNSVEAWPQDQNSSVMHMSVSYLLSPRSMFAMNRVQRITDLPGVMVSALSYCVGGAEQSQRKPCKHRCYSRLYSGTTSGSRPCKYATL